MSTAKIKSEAVDEFFGSINWQLLRTQKLHLLTATNHYHRVSMPGRDALTGILHLIDALQDFAADVLEIPGVFDTEVDDDDDEIEEI